MPGGDGGGVRALVLAALAALVAALAGGWPPTGVSVGRADHEPVTGWRLTDVLHGDTDGRGAKAGTIHVDEVRIDARGGTVRITVRWDEVCRSKSERFRFTWRFAGDISRVAKGSTVVTHPGLEFDGPNVCEGAFADYTFMQVLGDNDGSGTSLLTGSNAYVGPSTVFTQVGQSAGRFYVDANRSNVHVSGPRTHQISDRENAHHAWFKVSLANRVGWTYDAVYVYRAETGASAPPAAPPAGASTPAAPVSPGSIDLAGYCRSIGYPDSGQIEDRWLCRSDDLLNVVDMDEVCRWQLGRPDAAARRPDPSDPRTWICAVAAPAPGGTTAPIRATWTGTWNTEFGVTRLVQAGETVTGTYDWKGGRIDATVAGDRLVGTWRQETTFQPPRDAGDLEFTLAPDGGSFAGRWRYGSSGDWQPWTGVRMGP